MGVICFSGWKFSGKDTMAAYLIKNHGAIRAALADPLKDMVSEEFQVPRSFLDDPQQKESPILSLPVTPKDGFSKMLAEFMVKELRTSDGQIATGFYYLEGKFQGVVSYLGTDALRDLYHTPRSLAILKGSTNRFVRSDYWTDKAFQDIEQKLKASPLVVVSDLRYKSEIAQFKERFEDKAVFVRVNRHLESPSNDPSEIDLNGHPFDYYINNTGILQESYAQLEQVLKSIA